MWMAIIRLIVFLVSSLGYWEFIRNKTRINKYFLPAFTACCQIMLLYFAGILNCLEPVTFIIFLGGLICAVYYANKDRKFILSYYDAGYLFLLIALAILFIALHGHVFSGYDNFSHWALVVKNMLRTNRYPNFSDLLIDFKEYPLGSATFIYFFSKIVSAEEYIQMLAQSYLMICFLLPLFKFASQYKGVIAVYMTLFTNFIFCYCIWVTSLCVDTLLPLQGMATLLFIYSECLLFQSDSEKEKVSVLFAVPFLCVAMLIKNSGILFTIIACVIIFVSWLKGDKKLDWKKIVTVVLPFLTYYFWKQHCEYVFSDAAVSKHAVSAENYKQIFATKTQDDIKLIVGKMIRFTFSGKDLLVITLCMIVVGMLIFFVAGKKKEWAKKCLYFFIAALVLYFSWMIGICFMYIFSMPSEEAAILAGVERYRKTIFIAIYYMMSMVVIQYISNTRTTNHGKIFKIVMAFTLIAAWGVQNNGFITVFMPDATVGEYTEERRLWFDDAIRRNGVRPNKSYVVCIPSEDVAYSYYLCKYLLNSKDILRAIVQWDWQTEEFKDYDYVFVYDDGNEVINRWIEAHYPEQAGKTVIATGK